LKENDELRARAKTFGDNREDIKIYTESQVEEIVKKDRESVQT